MKPPHIQQNTCCEKCYGRQGTTAGGGIYCNNSFCPCHTPKPIFQLGKSGNYATDGSHTHCWNQLGSPACGIPLEKHKQCCLCDTLHDHPFVATPTQSEWMKDLELYLDDNNNHYSCRECDGDVMRGNLGHFIYTTIQKEIERERSQLLQEIEERMKEEFDKKFGDTLCSQTFDGEYHLHREGKNVKDFIGLILKKYETM